MTTKVNAQAIYDIKEVFLIKKKRTVLFKIVVVL
jgi:hypothetical protein